jgi:hypothetical protein
MFFESLTDLWLVVHITILYKGIHKIVKLISKKLYKKYMYIYEITCSLGQLDEKINHMKISKFWNFESKCYKENGTI